MVMPAVPVSAPLAPFRARVPPPTVVVPVYGLAAWRFRVPPARVKGLVGPPLTAPVKVALSAAESVVAAASVIGPAKVAALAPVPPSVGEPLSWTALVNESAAAVGDNVPPDR